MFYLILCSFIFLSSYSTRSKILCARNGVKLIFIIRDSLLLRQRHHLCIAKRGRNGWKSCGTTVRRFLIYETAETRILEKGFTERVFWFALPFVPGSSSISSLISVSLFVVLRWRSINILHVVDTDASADCLPDYVVALRASPKEHIFLQAFEFSNSSYSHEYGVSNFLLSIPFDFILHVQRLILWFLFYSFKSIISLSLFILICAIIGNLWIEEFNNTKISGILKSRNLGIWGFRNFWWIWEFRDLIVWEFGYLGIQKSKNLGILKSRNPKI